MKTAIIYYSYTGKTKAISEKKARKEKADLIEMKDLKPVSYKHLDVYKRQEQSKESNRAIKELIKLMGRNRDRLHDSMTAEQQETLEKYDDCVNEMYGLIELEIFSYAFRLGGRLMLATLMDSGEDA